MQLGMYRATLSIFEELKPLLAKPLSPTHQRILESAREGLLEIEKPWDTADLRSIAERMQAASRKSRLSAAEFLRQKPESRK
jgi:hypothetical protein